MAIYDKYGEEILSGGGSSGGTSANTLPTGATNIDLNGYNGVSASYAQKILDNYLAFIAEVDGDPYKVPLIIHTDQHGRLTSSTSGVMPLLGALINWYKVSKIVNLGDTCTTTFSPSSLKVMLNNNILYFPFSKSINVFGNHDTWDERSGSRIYYASQELLEPYFYNMAKRGGAGWFSVADERYMVKYIVFTGYQYKNGGNTTCMNSDQADFIIDELSANDGYDIILLSHEPINSQGATAVIAGDEIGKYTVFSSANVVESFLQMISARKNKSTGTFTDSEGVSHAYDFRNLKSDILVHLCGHMHCEGYQVFQNSIFEWFADWFDNSTFYFAYIDRKTKKFKRWKNDAANLVDDVLEFNIE